MTTPSTLYVTAVVPSDGISVFECWALQSGFITSSGSGTIGAKMLQLGNLANASYSDIPAHFAPGRHNAANVEYVMILSGLAYITLPNATESLYVTGGSSDSLLVVADIHGLSTGHITTYPGQEITRLIQVPTAGGLMPHHDVLYHGPCMPGINDAACAARRSEILNGLD